MNIINIDNTKSINQSLKYRFNKDKVNRNNVGSDDTDFED